MTHLRWHPIVLTCVLTGCFNHFEEAVLIGRIDAQSSGAFDAGNDAAKDTGVINDDLAGMPSDGKGKPALPCSPGEALLPVGCVQVCQVDMCATGSWCDFGMAMPCKPILWIV